MNKTWLIIKREYITRVRNKTFIISTFLTPLFFVGLIAAVIYMTPKDRPLPGTINDAEIVKR
jgi:ABC-2 type transport system permease protein